MRKTIELILYVLIIVMLGCSSARQANESEKTVGIFRGADYTAYQVDSVRVYFSFWFQTGFIGMGDSILNYIRFYDRTIADIGALFANGRLRGEMFFGDSVSFGIKKSKTLIECADSLSQELSSYNGPLARILFYTVKDTLGIKQYNLWVTRSKWEDGWGAFEHFTFDYSSGTVSNFKSEGFEL